jgi:hypothetical protein
MQVHEFLIPGLSTSSPGAVERPERLHPGRTKRLTSQITADDDPTSQTFASGDYIAGFQAAGTSRYFSPCSD